MKDIPEEQEEVDTSSEEGPEETVQGTGQKKGRVKAKIQRQSYSCAECKRCVLFSARYVDTYEISRKE